jgi:hypothetical protein
MQTDYYLVQVWQGPSASPFPSTTIGGRNTKTRFVRTGAEASCRNPVRRRCSRRRDGERTRDSLQWVM